MTYQEQLTYALSHHLNTQIYVAFIKITKEEGKFALDCDDFNIDNFTCIFGNGVDIKYLLQLIYDYIENNSPVDKEGHYQIEFIMSLEPEEIGDFGRVLMESYWTIEVINFKYYEQSVTNSDGIDDLPF